MEPSTTDQVTWFSHPVVWASGMAGAVVSLAHHKGLTLAQKLVTVFVGLMTAGFLTPAFAEWMKLSLDLVAAAGFLLGISGMLITAIVFNAATAARDNPRALLETLKILFLPGRWTAPPTPPPGPSEKGGQP